MVSCVSHTLTSSLPQASPHTHDDFHEEVRNAANGDHMLQAGLKISKMIVLGDVATGKTCLVNRWDWGRWTVADVVNAGPELRNVVLFSSLFILIS